MSTASKACPEDIAAGSWVARYDDEHNRRPVLGRVKDAYSDPMNGDALLLDIVLYAHTGKRVGRASPACGGPRGFEPACPAEFWEPIARPDFETLEPLFFYGDRLQRLRATASS